VSLLDEARRYDAQDPLAPFRAEFHMPLDTTGHEQVYLCGHSLGLQPRAARALVERELDDWARLGVRGHFEATSPWYSYHEPFRASVARLVGALPHEVVLMNSLTVNLHLMMESFYRPTAARHRILIEEHAFPSDLLAVRSQIQRHGFDPTDGLLVARAAPGESTLRDGALDELLEREGKSVALVLLAGVNYYTGEAYDLGSVSAAARRAGCAVGFDLAHGVGNVPLALHDWGADFAVWCSYKYLNGGPGAVAGCFVHERHGRDAALPRLAGWWGMDPARRFTAGAADAFAPQPGADGWQISNPPILSLAPLRAALDQFDAAGLDRLRAKSMALTGFLLEALARETGSRARVLTPAAPRRRGCQVSVRLDHGTGAVAAALEAKGIVVDVREPDVLRVSPVPLYNSFEDAARFAIALGRELGGAGG